jgi:hypothetical protein
VVADEDLIGRVGLVEQRRQGLRQRGIVAQVGQADRPSQHAAAAERQQEQRHPQREYRHVDKHADSRGPRLRKSCGCAGERGRQ